MKKKQRLLYKKIAVAVLVVLLILLLNGVWGKYQSFEVIQSQRELQVAEFNEKDQRVAELEAEIAFLNTQ